jgi:hypothetical protein
VPCDTMPLPKVSKLQKGEREREREKFIDNQYMTEGR